MRKVLFLMFLLLLMVLGAAGVKAQVRIGGNGAPNASAVLDLNATDATTGTKGLALPRVNLTSNTMLLPGVTQNLTGMLVYNANITLGVGVYYWNGSNWVDLNNNYFIGSDSIVGLSNIPTGARLEFNGTNWTPVRSDTFIGWNDNFTVPKPAPVGYQTISANYPQGCSNLNSWIAWHSSPTMVDVDLAVQGSMSYTVHDTLIAGAGIAVRLGCIKQK